MQTVEESFPRKVCPVAVVRLRLRFEEGATSTSGSVGLLSPGWQLAKQQEKTAPEGGKWTIGDLAYTDIGVVVPSQVQIIHTPPRQPSLCRVTIPWESLPIHPGILRAVGVEVFADAVTPDVLAKALRTGEPALSPRRDKLRFIGTAKSWSADGQKITIACKGFTGLLLDAIVPKNVLLGLDLSKSLVDVVQQLVDFCVATTGLRVVWEGEGDPPKVIEAGYYVTRSVRKKGKIRKPADEIKTGARKGAKAAAAGAVPPAQAGSIPATPPKAVDPTKATKGRTKTKKVPYLPIKVNQTFWDIITDITVGAGCAAYMDGDRLVVSPARSVFGAGTAKRFVDAKNVERLSYSREVGRRTVPGVEVRGWDPFSRKTMIVRWPPGIMVPKVKKAKGQAAASQQHLEVRTVAGVQSEAQMLIVAEALYHELRRQLTGGSLTTRDMSEIGEDDAGILSIVSGNSVDISPPMATWALGDLRRMPDREALDILKRSGVAAASAQAALEATRRVSTVFWVSRAQHTFDTKSGYRLDLQFSEMPRGDAQQGETKVFGPVPLTKTSSPWRTIHP